MVEKDKIVITAAKRTPTGNFGGQFKDVPTTQLGSIAIKAAITQSDLCPEHIDEVIMGCVLPAGLGQAPARQAALGADLPMNTPCTTVNKMCGSGMKSIMFAHDAIQTGDSKAIIAGGMESMSRAPYLLQRARFGYRLGHDTLYDHMMLDGLEDAYDKGKSMGFFAELCAKKYDITREAQDAFALESLKRAQLAAEKGLFSYEIVPVNDIHTDEGPKTAKPEKIPLLKPAFDPKGTVTAANSSSISDGASALLIMNSDFAAKMECMPLAKIVAHHSVAQEPAWFTTAPIGAIHGVVAKAGWNIEDVDLFEINEAFAVVTMVAMKELKLPHEKVNVHGGACVLGHPIGASGARILTTLIYALRERKLKRGIAALCIAGGEATAIAIESCE